uniref:uncharacterized protein LOC109952451 isoform X2 n=1 Tax=Monopterus albus TaxID=43700 RepID=UPI0009B4AF38|nr:uncharacterized protein LOC109952451 isoform X2 [Monopterus albus]
MDLMHQDHYLSEIKEENQDPDFDDQDHCKSEIKEENQDPDFVYQDRYIVGVKEENPDHRNNESTQGNKADSSPGPSGPERQISPEGPKHARCPQPDRAFDSSSPLKSQRVHTGERLYRSSPICFHRDVSAPVAVQSSAATCWRLVAAALPELTSWSQLCVSDCATDVTDTLREVTVSQQPTLGHVSAFHPVCPTVGGTTLIT